MRPVLTEEVISNSNTTWDLNTDTKADTETTCIHILSLQWHIQNVNFIVTDFPRVYNKDKQTSDTGSDEPLVSFTLNLLKSFSF
jgi:hypothetical protein